MDTTVGHLVRHYLPRSQTFIHTFLAHSRKFRPLVLTDVVQNLSAFPVLCVRLIEQEELDGFRRRLGHRFRAFMHALDYPNCFEDIIREDDIPLLHAHFGPMGYHALGLKRRLKLPLITSFHGYDASAMFRQAGWQRAFNRLFREGDLFLVVGTQMADRLCSFGCPRAKIRVQHVGIDLDRIPFRAREWPGAGCEVVLLYCGRLVEKKGVLDALLAFARVADRWKKLVFRIVGDGPLREVLKKAVQDLRLQSRVVLCGALSHGETLREMQQAHLFILPSAQAPDGDMEGAPVVLMEAQAAGLPVISTRHADIPEVVLEGKTGFLAPEYDTRALAACLETLLSHPDTWADMGRLGRLHVEQHYNIQKEIVHIEAEYADLLGI